MAFEFKRRVLPRPCIQMGRGGTVASRGARLRSVGPWRQPLGVTGGRRRALELRLALCPPGTTNARVRATERPVELRGPLKHRLKKGK